MPQSSKDVYSKERGHIWVSKLMLSGYRGLLGETLGVMAWPGYEVDDTQLAGTLLDARGRIRT